MLPGEMAQRRHHYERAFAGFLRERRVPFLSVDEARRALLPGGADRPSPIEDDRTALKSFDFVVYGPEGHLLIDVKGRRGPTGLRAGSRPRRFESWVTAEDVESLAAWERLFGGGFRGAFAFLYCFDGQPPDGLFHECFEDRGLWYALRVVDLDRYARHMRPRSERWRTVQLSAGDLDRLSEPLCPRVLAKSA